MKIAFYGVRGSTPCSSESLARYGGNTSSVVVDVPDCPPILLDLGTGVRSYGDVVPVEITFSAVALVTHLHWDHVQGLPFFQPVLRPGARLEVRSPTPTGGLGLADAVQQALRPPYFPVSLDLLPGEFSFVECNDDEFEIGPVAVTSRLIPHNGPTVGFRLDCGGRSLAYVPDHQQPKDGSLDVASSVLELADQVDLLIHDAQYTTEEFGSKCDWGHSTVEYAVEVAMRANARRLALFHHDPSHSDDFVDALAARAQLCAGSRLSVFAAREGATVDL